MVGYVRFRFSIADFQICPTNFSLSIVGLAESLFTTSYVNSRRDKLKFVGHLKKSAIGNRKSAISIHPLHYIRLQLGKRSNVSHTVPGVFIARWLSFSLVSLKKPGHEELLRQCGQAHSTRLSIFNDVIGVVRIHDLNHRSW